MDYKKWERKEAKQLKTTKKSQKQIDEKSIGFENR
jgi:translation initiation factor IF-3